MRGSIATVAVVVVSVAFLCLSDIVFQRKQIMMLGSSRGLLNYWDEFNLMEGFEEMSFDFDMEDRLEIQSAVEEGKKNGSNDAALAFTVENLGCHENELVAKCGHTKCFYHLSSTDGMGYTVGTWGMKRERAAFRNWKFSVYLENEYGIPRLAMDQPLSVTNITKEMSDCLQAKRQASNGHTLDHNIPDFSIPKRGDQTRYIVQLNRAAKYPNILFKCYSSLKDAITMSETDEYWNGISNYTTYLRNLRRETGLAKHVLYKEPYLLRDFQVLVDQEANFHYIDIGHRAPANVSAGVPRNSTLGSRAFHRCVGAFDILESVAKQRATNELDNKKFPLMNHEVY